MRHPRVGLQTVDIPCIGPAVDRPHEHRMDRRGCIERQPRIDRPGIRAVRIHDEVRRDPGIAGHGRRRSRTAGRQINAAHAVDRRGSL
ncbi:MAG: hypothetical protein MZV64_31515 [Ignavibacteriales bacterium]|nr:hypothetical protein [Ignavibacteriales bacterium]